MTSSFLPSEHFSSLVLFSKVQNIHPAQSRWWMNAKSFPRSMKLTPVSLSRSSHPIWFQSDPVEFQIHIFKVYAVLGCPLMSDLFLTLFYPFSFLIYRGSNFPCRKTTIPSWPGFTCGSTDSYQFHLNAVSWKMRISWRIRRWKFRESNEHMEKLLFFFIVDYTDIVLIKCQFPTTLHFLTEWWWCNFLDLSILKTHERCYSQ